MANYRARRPGFLLGWQMQVADYMFRGFPDDKIAVEILNADPNDKRSMDNAKIKLRRLRKDEKFLEYYKSIVTEWSVHNVGKALTKLSEQIDSDKPWIANKAANDVLLHSRKLIDSSEDNAVVIKMEGAIELGTPDADS